MRFLNNLYSSIIFFKYFVNLDIYCIMYIELIGIILLEFLNGIRDSLQGFFIFYKLESATSKPVIKFSLITFIFFRFLKKIGPSKRPFERY